MNDQVDKIADDVAEAVLRHARGNPEVAMELARIVAARLFNHVDEEWRTATREAADWGDKRNLNDYRRPC